MDRLPKGLTRGDDGVVRCFWASSDPLYLRYHDEEWGFPVADDRRLFEKICLEGFQSGLSWLTILRKRENFRAAFSGFDRERVARYGARDVARLLKDAGIVRHRGKIESTIHNASRARELAREHGSLAAFFWAYEPAASERPLRLTWPALRKMPQTPASIRLSKELKKLGFSFVGPTTVYAFMQAMGLVNDHVEGCAVRERAERARERFPPAAPVMIEVSAVGRRYGDVAAVDGVSFQVASGELLALVGGSGSGKTTTLKMINRLVEPDEGRVTIDGHDTASFEPHVLRRSIGYAFQGVGLFPHLTVAENVAVPLRLAGWSRERLHARVDEVMALLELEPALLGRFPAELSGGQQQRVGVARALAASPRVMLLDEPFAALDPLTRDRLQASFDALRHRLGLTAVFVTHDVAEALVLADRIGVMRAGRLVQVGTPAEIAGHPADEDVARLIDTPRRHAKLVASRFEAP